MPIGQFIVFFLLLLTGLLCKKYGVLTDAAVNSLNKFLLNIGIPCLIFARTATLGMDPSIFVNFMLAFAINLGLLMLFAAYARLYCRGKRFAEDDKPVVEYAIMAPNNGFMGFPVAITFFGNLGLLYMVGVNIAFNMTIFTYGIALMKRGRGAPGESMRQKLMVFARMIIDPKVSAAIVGIILCYNRVAVPGVALEYFEAVGSLATPLSMISIGTMLAGRFGLQSFRSRGIMEPVLNKLFVMPAIAAAVVWFLPLDPLVKTILIISNALPVGTTVAIQAEQYGRNKDIGSAAVVISTIFSIATIPLAAWLLHHAGL